MRIDVIFHYKSISVDEKCSKDGFHFEIDEKLNPLDNSAISRRRCRDFSCIGMRQLLEDRKLRWIPSILLESRMRQLFVDREFVWIFPTLE